MTYSGGLYEAPLGTKRQHCVIQSNRWLPIHLLYVHFFYVICSNDDPVSMWSIDEIDIVLHRSEVWVFFHVRVVIFIVFIQADSPSRFHDYSAID